MVVFQSEVCIFRPTKEIVIIDKTREPQVVGGGKGGVHLIPLVAAAGAVIQIHKVPGVHILLWFPGDLIAHHFAAHHRVAGNAVQTAQIVKQRRVTLAHGLALAGGADHRQAVFLPHGPIVAGAVQIRSPLPCKAEERRVGSVGIPVGHLMIHKILIGSGVVHRVLRQKVINGLDDQVLAAVCILLRRDGGIIGNKQLIPLFRRLAQDLHLLHRVAIFEGAVHLIKGHRAGIIIVALHIQPPGFQILFLKALNLGVQKIAAFYGARFLRQGVASQSLIQRRPKIASGRVVIAFFHRNIQGKSSLSPEHTVQRVCQRRIYILLEAVPGLNLRGIVPHRRPSGTVRSQIRSQAGTVLCALPLGMDGMGRTGGSICQSIGSRSRNRHSGTHQHQRQQKR